MNSDSSSLQAPRRPLAQGQLNILLLRTCLSEESIIYKMNNNPRVPIELDYRFSNKFYGPIILLSALNDACKHSRPARSPDLPLDGEQSPERAFHDFVNKLAQLCDIERGGKTVTSLVVLDELDHIEYRFTSNDRTTEELNHAQRFITSILNALSRESNHDIQAFISHILRKSLCFARPRVEPYVKALKKEVTSCINAIRRENTDESRSILTELEDLQGKLLFSHGPELTDDHFAQKCESLMKQIEQIHKSEVEVLIRNRAKEGRMNQSECWSELRHVAGRLLSYLRAAKTLVSTRKLWPELFENFEVCHIASSIPGPYIFKGKHSPDRMTADRIIGCMTSNTKKMKEYKSHAQQLQKFELDKAIRNKTNRQKFHPIVHAEVLLLDWLERDGGTRATRFFNGYKYIGCSKPTCRLCEYYFSVHTSGVEVRSPHRNLYFNWRMPDVYGDQGLQAIEDRKKLMDKILVFVRNDAFRVLVEKVPEGKRHDSNTDPTYQLCSISVGRTEDMEHLEADLKSLDFDSSNSELMLELIEPASFERINNSSPESDDNSDDDNDDGGVGL